MFWAAEEWRKGPPLIFVESIAKVLMGVPKEPAIVTFAEASIRQYGAILNAHLEGRHYVMGDKVTLADFDLAATFTHISRMSLPYSEFPNIIAWQQRMLDEIPAWSRTRDLAEERMAPVTAMLNAAK